MPSTDYYATLGVARDATADDIKRAYRKLAMTYHPDRNNDDPAATEKFKEVNEAYAVLSDPDKRKQYDMFGAEGFGQRYSRDDIFRGFDFGRIFDELDLGGGGGGFDFRQIFGGGRGRAGRGGFNPFGGGQPRNPGPSKGRNLTTDVVVSFHEALFGGTRTVEVSGPDGPESIAVRVPKGIRTGKTLRVRERGHPGSGGGPRGDLMLQIKVAEHPDFKIKGDNLETTANVALSTLVLGGSAQVVDADGETHTLKIPPGTAVGTRLRLKGKGFIKGDGRGDLLVRLAANVPKELSEAQREHFEALRASGL